MRIRVVREDAESGRKIVHVENAPDTQKFPSSALARAQRESYAELGGNYVRYYTEPDQPDLVYKFVGVPGRYWASDVNVPDNPYVPAGSYRKGERTPDIPNIPMTQELRALTEVRHYFVGQRVAPEEVAA